MASDRTVGLLAGGMAVTGLGVAVLAVLAVVFATVDSLLASALLAVGALAGLLCATAAALGYRRVGAGTGDGPSPFAAAGSAAALGGMATVLAVQEVPRLFRALGLAASGAALLGAGLLLVASSRTVEGT